MLLGEELSCLVLSPPAYSVTFPIGRILILVWQTGQMEGWIRRFRVPAGPNRPQPENAGAMRGQNPAPAAAQAQEAEEEAVSALTAFLRLAEQILFVFVASLWPNAVGDPIRVDLGEPQRQNDRDDERNENER